MWNLNFYKYYLSVALCLILLLTHAGIINAQSPGQKAFEGYWMDDDQVLAVEIMIQENRLIGTIIWLDEPLDDFGEPVRDVMNREPKFRSRKVMGMQVLRGFRWDGSVWKGGEYYDFTSGHWYNARISMEEEEKLKLTGYYGILFFLGKNKRWYKVEELPTR